MQSLAQGKNSPAEFAKLRTTQGDCEARLALSHNEIEAAERGLESYMAALEALSGSMPPTTRPTRKPRYCICKMPEDETKDKCEVICLMKSQEGWLIGGEDGNVAGGETKEESDGSEEV